MKKLLLTISSIAVAMMANATDYTVYNNGVLNPELHVYGWYNDGVNFTAANPDGTGSVFEFKARDGGTSASMGLNMEAPQNTGKLHNATLNFSWYANTSAKYTIRLTSVKEQNYSFTPTADQLGKWNTISLPVATTFNEVAEQWNANTNLGVGYVFSVIVENAKPESVIYFNNIYYSNVDDSWVAPAVTIPEPETVPTPVQAAADVFSFFSSYGSNVSFGIGGWGQSTQYQTKQIDGKDVMFLRNFNYLGLDNFNINISDYDFMHVDYWTDSANTPFGFVPISLEPTVDTPIWNAPAVKANEWNSYDAKLADFSADMTSIRQLKFVANQDNGTTPIAYIANIYFYKEGTGGGETPDPDDPDQPVNPGERPTYNGQVSGKYTQTMSDETKEYEYTLDYSITYNADKTLTFTGAFSWENDEAPVGANNNLTVLQPGVFALEADNQTTPLTTERTFEQGETMTVTYQTAVALGVVKQEITYTVGANNVETGVEMVETTDGEAVYYDLQGRKVRNPERGIFIKVQNGKALKVVKN